MEGVEAGADGNVHSGAVAAPLDGRDAEQRPALRVGRQDVLEGGPVQAPPVPGFGSGPSFVFASATASSRLLSRTASRPAFGSLPNQAGFGSRRRSIARSWSATKGAHSLGSRDLKTAGTSLVIQIS